MFHVPLERGTRLFRRVRLRTAVLPVVRRRGVPADLCCLTCLKTPRSHFRHASTIRHEHMVALPSDDDRRSVPAMCQEFGPCVCFVAFSHFPRRARRHHDTHRDFAHLQEHLPPRHDADDGSSWCPQLGPSITSTGKATTVTKKAVLSQTAHCTQVSPPTS